ncbi:MAG: 23S rRNA (uracil(1939)-C(5))-methyltransferase RlmD [Clostridia bacterium]
MVSVKSPSKNNIDEKKTNISQEKLAVSGNESQKSKDNIVLDCPFGKECGGCNGKGAQNELIELKKKKLELLFKPPYKVLPIISMENPFHYRNKVHAVVVQKKGEITRGVYAENTHKVVAVKGCLIENEKAEPIIETICSMLKSFKILPYDEDRKTGLLRHILVRVGHKSGQIMVVLVLSSPIFPSKNNFVKALIKAHCEISTIVLNVNERSTSMVLGKKDIVIYGKGYIEDMLCDKVFKLSPQSFYQINSTQTEILYKKAIEYANFKGDEIVLDAYCGIGTIGIISASFCKNVIGVELNKDAVNDAKENAKRNGLKNIEFVCDDAGRYMNRLAADNKKIDVLFIDPPRSGCSDEFINATNALKPAKIIYISCGAESLAQNIKQFSNYTISPFQPVDMFPFTPHVECVVLMSRK